MLVFLNHFFLSAIELLTFYFLTSGLLLHQSFSKRRFFVLGGIMIILNSLGESLAPGILITLLENLLMILFLYSVLSNTILHTLCVYFMEYIFIAICSISTFPILGLSHSDTFQGIGPYIGSSIVLIIAYLCYRFLPLWRLYELILRYNTTVLLIIANTFLITIGLILYARFDSNDFFSHYILFFLFTLILVFLNGEVYLTNWKHLQEKRQLESFQAYLPIVENLIEQVRDKQHDYHNHLQAIRGLCYTSTDFDSLQKSILDTTSYYSQRSIDTDILKLNKPLVAGFLMEKINDATQKQKHLELEIKQYVLHSTCNEFELIEYMGILIDNAIEATPIDGYIYASLNTTEDKYLNFTISNPGPSLSPTFMKYIFRRGSSTKSATDKPRGLGLHKLYHFIQRNNGDITVSNETINDIIYIKFSIKL